MAGAGIDGLGLADGLDGLGGVAQGTGRVDDVVKQDAGLALDVADDVHDLAHVGALAALVHDGKAHVDLGRERAGAGDGADVRRNDAELVMIEELLVELGHIITGEQRVAEHVVHRDIEEALDLRGVEIHRQHAVSARAGDEVRHQLGGDGVAALGLAVLTGIAEVRNDRGDAACRGAAEGVDHDEQLHQVVVDGLAGGLHHEHVAAADGFVDGDGDLTVCKGGHGAVAEVQPQLGTDSFCEGHVGIRSEDLDLFSVSNHFVTSLFSERRIRTALNILRARWDYFLCFAAHSFLLDWRARAMPSACAGTSSVMVEPAPM